MSKNRKPGEWIAIHNGRAKIERDNRTGRGLSNIPNVMDVGSAAYRRLLEKREKGKGIERSADV